jgi:hypothetical protein
MTARDWTPQQKLMALMRLPWSVRVKQDDVRGSFTAQVAEIPEVMGTGNSMKELGKSLWVSLADNLERRLKRGDMVPLPPGKKLPWDGERSPRVEAIELQVPQRIGHLIIRPKGTAA